MVVVGFNLPYPSFSSKIESKKVKLQPSTTKIVVACRCLQTPCIGDGFWSISGIETSTEENRLYGPFLTQDCAQA